MGDELTKEEAERRADAVARRLLNTPPQPRRVPKRDKPVAKPDHALDAKPGKRGPTGAGS